MRNILTAILLVGAASATQAAELKIAFIDPLKAISDTEAVKAEMAALDKDTAADRARHEKLSGDMRTCKQKMTSDLATMSATEQARMRTDCETKARDWQALGQTLQNTIGERQQAVLKDFDPKVRKAIDALAKEGGYDALIQKEAALFYKPELDVSAKLTAKLNAMK